MVWPADPACKVAVMSSTDSTSLPVQILSSTRLFPANRTASTPPPLHVTPLSVLDTKCDTFGTTGIVWLYESDAHLPGGGDTFVPSMIRSLQVALSSFPWWCGSLYRCPPEGSVDPVWAEQVASHLPRHCVRFGRLLLTYGAQSDPGVPLLLADCSLPLTAVAPTPAELAGMGAWRCQALLAGDLCKLEALQADTTAEEQSTAGTPCMMVQLTTFACGGRAVAIRIVHSLADLQAIATFVHHWTAVHHSLNNDTHCTDHTVPMFDPQALDRAAAGDINAAQPDEVLLKAAQSLPMEHWDRWASAAHCPAPFADQHVVPSGVDPNRIARPGMTIQWDDWDVLTPNKYLVLHFAADELQRIRAEATAPSLRPSTFRALCAHMWSVVSNARGLRPADGASKFICYLGVRPKLLPPLPPHFLGSPVVEVATILPAATVCMGSLADIAAALNQSLRRFDASTLPALLHSFAYEDHPSRWCHGMFGRKHVALTSWQHNNLYEVQFVRGHRPRYVDGVIDAFLDGLGAVMEAGPGSGDLLVQIRLQPEVVSQVLADPRLRRFRQK